MKGALVDLNVWLALLVVHHEHHSVALQWFDKLAASEAGMCRFVQLGVMRLLANPAIMAGHAIGPLESWKLIGTLLEDERVHYLAEPGNLENALPSLLRYAVPTGKLIGDAYLAAFAIGAGLRLVTFDRGFLHFRNAEVQLLNG